jgi:hypothetical protein
MRAAVVLVLVAGLCACRRPAETIQSVKPLYRPSDAAGATALKSGLWVQASSDCRFDETSSTGTWPACASWMIVRPRVLIRHPRTVYPLDGLETEGYVLAAGYPRILQLGAPRGQRTWRYDYKGLRPLTLDDRGAIASARIWSANCFIVAGPASESLPASDAASSFASADVPAPSSDDVSPVSSLSADAPDPCLAVSRDDVRAAVIAAENPKDASGVYHWVREQEH